MDARKKAPRYVWREKTPDEVMYYGSNFWPCPEEQAQWVHRNPMTRNDGAGEEQGDPPAWF